MTGQPLLTVLELPEPYDLDGVLGWLAARAVPGSEAAELDADGVVRRYARSLRTPAGPAFLEIERAGADGRGRPRLELAVHAAGGADPAPLVALARRALDLDRDPAASDAALARDPRLAARVAAIPGMRLPGAFDAAELLLQVVVGQQISVTAARGHVARLAERLGEPVDSPVVGVDRLFPSPGAIAEAIGAPAEPDAPLDPDRILRLPRRTAEAIRRLMLDLDAGALDPVSARDADELRAALVARPGIGPWTAGYASLRLMGDPDAWPTGDVALLEGARRLGMLQREPSRAAGLRELDALAEAWRPFRAYAALHLWRAAAGPAGAP